jgi:hypothetical protein
MKSLTCSNSNMQAEQQASSAKSAHLTIVCAWCHRDLINGEWREPSYPWGAVSEPLAVSHGICAGCLSAQYPEL